MEMSNINPQALIERERFDLRPLRISDKGPIDLYAGDERVARMSPSIPHPLPPGVSEAFINRALAQNREEEVWAIDGVKSGGSELMGVVMLKRLEGTQSEIGFWIAPPFWNTGLGRGAVSALIETNPLNNSAFFAYIFQDNPALAKVLTHNGFEYLGDAESYCVARDANVPTWTYTKKLNLTK